MRGLQTLPYLIYFMSQAHKKEEYGVKKASDHQNFVICNYMIVVPNVLSGREMKKILIGFNKFEIFSYFE